MIKTEFLKELDRFNLVMKKRVLSNYSGNRESTHVGSGLTFKDYREYVQGDDFRAIDWKVYAKTEKLYIRRFEEERNLSVHIIVDASRSMDYGDPNKYDYAAMIGLGFAYMAMKNNESYEFSIFNNTLNTYRGKASGNRLVGIVDFLSRVKIEGFSNFQKSIQSYKKLIKSRSLVIIVSDFLYNLAEIEETLYHFKKNEIILVQVLDSQEKHLPFEGTSELTDAESGGLLKTFVSKRMQKDYTERLYSHIYTLKEIADSIGAEFISVTTNVPIFETFYHILTKT
ncbi:DUF58 domain-containing protein [Candidatus Woesearchaeota archaeon]|nr:DUF58 domain-containing protein [Candidatus Woesearchaeota archaeon]